MPFQYATSISLSKYGISTNGIWSPQKVKDSSSRNFDGLRFSVASSKKPASPLTAMNLKFANDKVHNPTPLTGDNYILETEYTTWLHGAENIDLLFNGKSSDGTEKTFGKIRVNKPSGATAPIGAKIYVTDNADVKVQNERSVLASMKSATGDGAGDLIYVKSEINLKDHTFSAWAVPRMSEGGVYVETPASDANLLAKDVPFFDNTITEFSGVSYNVLASAPTINYSCGAWLRNLSVKPNTYTVTGVKDINVTGVKLKQGTLEYDGAISGENVTFTNVLSGTYDVVATYASGYEASGLATLTVVVPSENMTGLNFTSRAISATAKEVSGITDANVKTADLYNAEQLVAIGKFNPERTNVSFGKVEPGTYTIKTTYNDGYVAAADADTTVTVADTAITNLKITSLKALYTVSGTIDKYIDSVKLKTTGKEYVGVLDRTLNTVTFNDVADGTYTIETTREQNYTNSPTSTTSVTVNGASLPTAMTLTSTAPADGITLRMAVLSDTQYGRGGLGVADHSRAHFINAMAKMKEKVGGTWDNLDVLLIPGDITHNSYINEYQAFVEDLQTALPYGSHTKVLFLRGNHDAKEGNNAGASTTRLSNFVTELSKYDPTLKSPNNITNVNGYQFVTVSQDTQKGNDEPSTNEYIMAHNYLHSPETVSWFTQTMTDAAAQSNGKPIFVGMHPNAYEKVQANTITAENGTVFGSYPVNGYKNQATAKSDYWATSELYNAIKPHANAVTFSGHSHWTVANESSIHQRDFTSMNTGAVNNMEIENAWDESFQPNRLGFANENESNGYFITVNTEQKINVERMDLARAN
ncbi:MAG: metallophosphoesterase, partial [Oscillospiraceae bacterium]